MFIRGEAMDIGVPLTNAEAAILSQLVEVYIGLRMCTSIGAISERILLHCSLTSAPGHHASRRWIVEKAIAATHDAMQDDATHATHILWGSLKRSANTRLIEIRMFSFQIKA